MLIVSIFLKAEKAYYYKYIHIIGDGKLDFSELCAFVVERIYKKKLDHDFEELFRILDQDGEFHIDLFNC